MLFRCQMFWKSLTRLQEFFFIFYFFFVFVELLLKGFLFSVAFHFFCYFFLFVLFFLLFAAERALNQVAKKKTGERKVEKRRKNNKRKEGTDKHINNEATKKKLLFFFGSPADSKIVRAVRQRNICQRDKNEKKKLTNLIGVTFFFAIGGVQIISIFSSILTIVLEADWIVRESTSFYCSFFLLFSSFDILFFIIEKKKKRAEENIFNFYALLNSKLWLNFCTIQLLMRYLHNQSHKSSANSSSQRGQPIFRFFLNTIIR